MTTHVKTAMILLCSVWALMLTIVPRATGTSLFSGLVLAQAEQGGVKVVDIYPNSPSKKAGIKLGDVIVEFNGQKITALNDFITKSHQVDKTLPEITVKVLRGDKLLDITIASYSMPVYQAWKVKVIQPPYTGFRGVSLFQYWIEKGRGKLQENQRDIPPEAKLANYREAIKMFFFALHYSPDSPEVGLMVADTYKKMAELYQAAGSVTEALQHYTKATEFYNKSSDKLPDEADDKLRKILTNLQDVEERLYKLLPQEELELQQTSLNPTTTKDE